MTEMVGWSDYSMKNKQIVADLLERLPEDASLHDIAQEIEFVAGIQEGFRQLDQGRGIPVEEVEKMIGSWASDSCFSG